MKISAIVATDLNGCIGKGNALPWHLPADLRFFKQTTVGHHILMGRKCFESIGSKPLPSRTNIVISRSMTTQQSEQLYILDNLQQAFNLGHAAHESEFFICGGAEIYSMAMPFTTRIYYTQIHTVVSDGDVFFPKINPDEWVLVSEKHCEKDEKNEFDYTFKVYDRK